MKALSINVYRTNMTDSTNGGISSKYDTLLLICDEGYINIDENNIPENAVRMVQRTFLGREANYIEPIARPEPKHIGWMAGGNIAYSSDSRFSELSGGHPVNIHDRQETQEIYDLLTR